MNSVGRYVLLCALLLVSNLEAAQQDAWTATWAASPEPSDADVSEPLLDHLHPNDAGYQAMAEAIDLALFH